MDRRFHGTLEIEEDLGSQRRQWRAERAGWAVGAGIMAAAVAGLLGAGGPLAVATAREGALTVAYPRVARADAPEELVIRVGHDHAGPIELGPAFLRAVRLDSIAPEPAARAAGPDGALRVDSTPGAELRVRFRPTVPGPLPIAVRAAGARIEARSLVLP